MDYSATFARHFARLVSLLRHESGNVDEQKIALRALVMVNKNGPVTLIARVVDLLANDKPVPSALTGVRDIAEQMAAHSILEIKVGAGSSAAELLGLARIIGSDAKQGKGGEVARQKLAALRAAHIEFVTTKKGTAPAPPQAVPETTTVEIVTGPESSVQPLAPNVVQDAPTLLSQLAAPDVSKLTPVVVFASLDEAKTAEAATPVLDDVVALAEHSARIGKSAVVGELFHGVVVREGALSEGDVRRAYALAVRRLSKPALLRAVTTLIPKKPEKKQQYYEVLVRAGDDGAEALIGQIAQAQTTADRKTLFEVLQLLDDAVPTLKRMLGDSRWFVVRNAADLLGEMTTIAAEDALIALLRHTDDRVRRSATNALLKLGTPDALKGIYEAVSDSSPEVRLQATAAIATKKDGRTAVTLIRAIEDEEDADVQLAMIAALGRVATTDAVQKLIKMAEPEARLFRKKASNLRLAAVQALAEAKTPAALSALRELLEDKDREVRDMATRALAHSGR